MIVRVSGLVWIQKSDLTSKQLINIKNKLIVIPKRTTDISSKSDPEPLFLFEETDSEIGVPRAWYKNNVKKKHGEICEVSYGKPMMKLSTLYKSEGVYEDQSNALRVFDNKLDANPGWCGFLLKAGCGWGKTSCSSEFARRLGRKTIILVHKETLFFQWKMAIKEIMPDARIGAIRQDTCDYIDKDFVIAMNQSLYEDNGKYPAEIYDEFGTVISDECHRVSSPTWSSIIHRFNAAYRIGLSATPYRKDNTEDVFLNHISDITYKATVDAQVPDVRVLKTGAVLYPINNPGHFCSVQNLNSAQVSTQIASDIDRTRLISDEIFKYVKLGKKIMVVSDRLFHLREMARLLRKTIKASGFNEFNIGFGYYTGEWYTGETWKKNTSKHRIGDEKLVKRTEGERYRAESANVIFTTLQCTEEGLDIPAVDVLFLSVPGSDPEQTVGRVRRWCYPRDSKCKRLCDWRYKECRAKGTPIVVDVLDVKVKRLMNRWFKRKSFYDSIGVNKIGGLDG